MMCWNPRLGARPSALGARFSFWAPGAETLEVVVGDRSFSLEPGAEGYFDGEVSGASPGTLYSYEMDGRGPFPDPASRFQPQGVHGPSEVIDPDAFEWTDQDWSGVPLEELVLYELHIGAFTPDGTFSAARRKLPYLKDLGVTAIELMPVADFPGERNWGYDGVAMFAPARCYGSPDDLRRLINEAHRIGLAVYLDVVYNHLGPDGAYAATLSKSFFSGRHRSPWGAGINFDGPGSKHVRAFFIENALHWIHEYHIDGLRLDATHALVDESPQHFLAQLSAAVSEAGRPALLIAEDTRNLTTLINPEPEGWGLDGVWADDFHHQVRSCLAGDDEAYYRDFTGSAADIAVTARQGWFFTGQYASHYQAHRGTDPTGLGLEHFVLCLQNHDQIGNRPFGERLHHQIELAAWRAATTLLLILPETPLLFMGQEWAASTPFLFFTDHHAELGRKVAQGRRRELSGFRAFRDLATRSRIPNPQDPRSFTSSKLNWAELESREHAATVVLYRRLLKLRTLLPRTGFAVEALDEDTLTIHRDPWLGVVRLRGSGVSACPELSSYRTEVHTEQPGFTTDPAPPRIDPTGGTIGFHRPGAVVVKRNATI